MRKNTWCSPQFPSVFQPCYSTQLCRFSSNYPFLSFSPQPSLTRNIPSHHSSLLLSPPLLLTVYPINSHRIPHQSFPFASTLTLSEPSHQPPPPTVGRYLSGDRLSKELFLGRTYSTVNYGIRSRAPAAESIEMRTMSGPMDQTDPSEDARARCGTSGQMLSTPDADCSRQRRNRQSDGTIARLCSHSTAGGSIKGAAL